MTKVKCTNCRQEVYVEMYFHDARITVADNPLFDTKCYEAVVNGRAICPSCGTTINEIFNKSIYPEDIIKLAVGGRNRGSN